MFQHQEECSQQDTAPDESVQRSVDLDELDDVDMDIVDQEMGVVDILTPAPHYLSQSRSLSRLSRMDAHRVRDTISCDFPRLFMSPPGYKSHFCFFFYFTVKGVLAPSNGAGYLPMTPGVDNPVQVTKVSTSSKCTFLLLSYY